jgi:hypothetical protein
MNGYTIDTDAGIGSVLSNFDTEYIMHVIDDSLSKKFRPFDGPMPNMVDVLERQFKMVLDNAPDYKENIMSVRSETYIEIISRIASFYQLNITVDLTEMDPENLHTIAKFMYDAFISRFTDNMINFFTSYIIDNSDTIYNYLKSMDNINRPRDNGAYAKNNFTDEKFILIHANANMVIYNIAGYDIAFTTLLRYFFEKPVADYLSTILEDVNDIYRYHYANYILSNNAPEIITRIKLELQARTFQNNAPLSVNQKYGGEEV